MFWKLDLFQSSGEGVRDTYSTGPLERANISHWSAYVIITTAVCTLEIELSMGEKMKFTIKKFECVWNNFDIRAVFKIKHTLRSLLMKTTTERDLQWMAQCICECGRYYIGETGRLLTVRLLHEHGHNLRGSSRKLKLRQG
jgi:hypothetical protein